MWLRWVLLRVPTLPPTTLSVKGDIHGLGQPWAHVSPPVCCTHSPGAPHTCTPAHPHTYTKLRVPSVCALLCVDREKYWEYEYEEVVTPNMFNFDLWVGPCKAFDAAEPDACRCRVCVASPCCSFAHLRTTCLNHPPIPTLSPKPPHNIYTRHPTITPPSPPCSDPLPTTSLLQVTSGHADHYKDNMFHFEVEKQLFGLKPMNCPGHCLMFKSRTRSYRDLPLRYADFGVLHRNEYRCGEVHAHSAGCALCLPCTALAVQGCAYGGTVWAPASWVWEPAHGCSRKQQGTMKTPPQRCALLVQQPTQQVLGAAAWLGWVRTCARRRCCPHHLACHCALRVPPQRCAVRPHPRAPLPAGRCPHLLPHRPGAGVGVGSGTERGMRPGEEVGCVLAVGSWGPAGYKLSNHVMHALMLLALAGWVWEWGVHTVQHSSASSAAASSSVSTSDMAPAYPQ